MLKKAGKAAPDLPSRLTDERRKKLYWWVTHPIMLWIEKHHVLVSMTVTVVIIAIIAIVMATTKLWEEEPEEDIFPVWIGSKLPGLTNSAALPQTESTDGDGE